MARTRSILIVEDEKNTREGLKWSLSDSGNYEVHTAADALEALDMLREAPFDLMLTDLKMPGMDGMELLAKAKAQYPDLEVIILTAHGSVEGAVEATKMGAFNYLLKPVNLKELGVLVTKALEHKTLREENLGLREENLDLREKLEGRYGFDHIIGKSPGMQAIFQKVAQVAPTKATVLISGESGTGKELIANAIHFRSPRKSGRFVAINCGALASTLLESELFGHEAGAFTDAKRQKIGRFEMADGGTLFLDEITETSPEFQVKLLRVLQEQQFERVGGTEPIRVDVRVLAATNKNLEALVEKGEFREDLYYRLNVVSINIPPLREREEDIPLLVQAALEEFCRENGKKPLSISPKAMAALRQYSWPGNVRQLRNVIEGLVVLATRRIIQVEDLPESIHSHAIPSAAVKLQVGTTVEEMEKHLILATLKHVRGNKAEAARMLGLGRKTLYRKLDEYGFLGEVQEKGDQGDDNELR